MSVGNCFVRDVTTELCETIKMKELKIRSGLVVILYEETPEELHCLRVLYFAKFGYVCISSIDLLHNLSFKHICHSYRFNPLNF